VISTTKGEGSSALTKAVTSASGKRSGSARPLSGSVKVTSSSDPNDDLKSSEAKAKIKAKRGESPKVIGQNNSLANKFNNTVLQGQNKSFEPIGIGSSSLYKQIAS
jgi:hypothetical protein